MRCGAGPKPRLMNNLRTFLFVIFFLAWGELVPAYPVSDRVHDTPGGEVVGLVRAGDVVEILRTQTIHLSGEQQRWAYIEYGDAHSFGRGWVNLEAFDMPEQPPPSDEHRGSGGDTGLRAPIWDIDIDCDDRRGGRIRGCRLRMQVELDRQTLAEAYEKRLNCAAELHWTTPNGDERISADHASKLLVLSDYRQRPSLDLRFDFDYPGASDVLVENQACHLQ